MTSTTEFFLGLQKVYQDKAAKDKDEFKSILREVFAQRRVAEESLSSEEIDTFCKQSTSLEVTALKPLSEELKHGADVSEL